MTIPYKSKLTIVRRLIVLSERSMLFRMCDLFPLCHELECSQETLGRYLRAIRDEYGVCELANKAKREYLITCSRQRLRNIVDEILVQMQRVIRDEVWEQMQGKLFEEVTS